MTTSLEDRGDVARHSLFTLMRKCLSEIASRAITLHKRTPEDFAVIAINVDDPRWRPLVDKLMPNTPEAEWQQQRDQNAIPVACGSIPDETIQILSDILPGISRIRKERPPQGEVYALIFGDGGCSVYSVPFAPTVRSSRNRS